jgi:hypothetical protein
MLWLAYDKLPQAFAAIDIFTKCDGTCVCAGFAALACIFGKHAPAAFVGALPLEVLVPPPPSPKAFPVEALAPVARELVPLLDEETLEK